MYKLPWVRPRLFEEFQVISAPKKYNFSVFKVPPPGEASSLSRGGPNLHCPGLTARCVFLTGGRNNPNLTPKVWVNPAVCRVQCQLLVQKRSWEDDIAAVFQPICDEDIEIKRRLSTYSGRASNHTKTGTILSKKTDEQQRDSKFASGTVSHIRTIQEPNSIPKTV